MATNSHNDTSNTNSVDRKHVVCVAGASGFIGSAIALRFLELGHKVVLPLRSSSQEDQWNAVYGDKYKGRLFTVPLIKEVTEEGAFDEAIQGCDVIVHAASPVTFTVKTNAETDILKPAIDGTLSLLNSAKKSDKVKMVVITSSLSAFTSIRELQTTRKEIVIDEGSWNPITHEAAAKMTNEDGEELYSASKALSEKAAWEFVKDSTVHFKLFTDAFLSFLSLPPFPDNFSFHRLGPSTVVGANPSPCVTSMKNAGSTFAIVAGSLWDKKEFPGHDGLRFRPEHYVSINSVVEAHVSAALNPSISAGKRYILSSDRSSIELLVREMVKAQPELASHLPPVSGEVKEEEQPRARYRVDASKAEKELGFKYEPFEEYVGAFVESVYNLALADGKV